MKSPITRGHLEECQNHIMDYYERSIYIEISMTAQSIYC